MSRSRFGFIAGVGAFGLWGLFPLYFPLLEPAAPVEILAHRMVWSLVVVVAALALTTGFAFVKHLGRRRAGWLAVAALLVSTNWGLFIYGVNSDQVVETSLGYFINPLVTVALGVGLLHEKLRRAQWFAVGIGAIAVLVLAVDYGRPPWIALSLATTFALYSLIKKRVGIDGMQSLAVETTFLVVPAALYLLWLGQTGRGTFSTEGVDHGALLVAAGVVTAVPLVLFGAAAIRIPLTSVGLLQYITPSLQFLIGVLVYHEAMPASRWAGFALVWVALAILAGEAVRSTRREPEPVEHEHEHEHERDRSAPAGSREVDGLASAPASR